MGRSELILDENSCRLKVVEMVKELEINLILVAN